MVRRTIIPRSLSEVGSPSELISPVLLITKLLLKGACTITKTNMKKLIAFIILFLAAIFLAPRLTWLAQDAYADEVRSSSAKLAPVVNSQKDYALDTRTRAVRNVFEKYNSPLVDQASFFVKYADEYEVDWKLLPSIAGLESTFGRFLMPGSYNAYGWGGGHIYFESWEDGIKTINKAIRENYINRGATDVWSIGPIYAESKTWSVRVNSFMQEINEEYLRLSIFSVLPTI